LATIRIASNAPVLKQNCWEAVLARRKASHCPVHCYEGLAGAVAILMGAFCEGIFSCAGIAVCCQLGDERIQFELINGLGHLTSDVLASAWRDFWSISVCLSGELARIMDVPLSKPFALATEPSLTLPSAPAWQHSRPCQPQGISPGLLPWHRPSWRRWEPARSERQRDRF